MGDMDYSNLRSVADEPHWNEFVQRIGGTQVAPLIKRPNVKNADFLFPKEKVVAELKIFETEFAHSNEMAERMRVLYADRPDIKTSDLPREMKASLVEVFRKPLQRIITKANRQIRETKLELGLKNHRGVVICVNDNFRGVPPGIVIELLRKILSGTSYSSIDALIYQTNHYIELPDNPYACLLWYPMYSEKVGGNLDIFVNELGRAWRAFAEALDGPFEFSEEREAITLDGASTVRGARRNTRYIDTDN